MGDGTIVMQTCVAQDIYGLLVCWISEKGFFTISDLLIYQNKQRDQVDQFFIDKKGGWQQLFYILANLDFRLV